MSELKAADWLIAFCTFVAPFAAVHAQWWIEKFRETRQRQLDIFRTLMATRMAILSDRHVEALNAIPIEFYNVKAVMDRWEEYMAHLIPSVSVDQNEYVSALWNNKRADLLKQLLAEIGTRLGYPFNQAQIDRVYLPQLHNWVEEDRLTINRRLAQILTGELALPVVIHSPAQEVEVASTSGVDSAKPKVSRKR